MSKRFQLISNIVIGILAFLLALTIFLTVFAVSDELKTYSADEDSLIYSLQDGRYYDLVRNYHRNQALNAKTSKNMEECYAIARYYEAALDYQLALLAEDTAQQKDAEERMSQAANEMGDFSYAKKEIDELLSK